ncbi:MAG TPA: hypothetical protein VH593_07235, partial [Ktedonobacteraceae bacterium]
GSLGSLMNRSFKMSHDVYAAMAARGFTGQLRSYQVPRMRFTDWLAVVLALVLAGATVIAGYALAF